MQLHFDEFSDKTGISMTTSGGSAGGATLAERKTRSGLATYKIEVGADTVLRVGWVGEEEEGRV